jgi:hypothetical protein
LQAISLNAQQGKLDGPFDCAHNKLRALQERKNQAGIGDQVISDFRLPIFRFGKTHAQNIAETIFEFLLRQSKI